MRTLTALALVALVVATAAGARTHATYHPITVDGSCADWTSDEVFPTATSGFDVRITWDAETSTSAGRASRPAS